MKIFRHLKSLTVAAFALALLCVAFTSTTKASADDKGFTAAYNPETDMIDITAPDKTVIEIYVVKDAETELTAKAKKAYTATVSGTSVSVSLTDKKAGVKAADGKPLYLYMAVVPSGSAVKVEGEKANFKLAASEVKKIDSVTIDYVKAYTGCTVPVLTVTYSTANSTTPITIKGDDLASVVVGDIVGKAKVASNVYSGTEFTGGILYGLITQEEAGKNGKVSYVKHKLSVQILGSASGQTIGGAAYDGVRNSKAKAVSAKSPAKATKAKVDYLKGTIALKSGLDYAVLGEAVTPSAISASAWYTILPADKDNGTNTSWAVASVGYTYIKKLKSDSTTDEKDSFYKGDKIKSVSLSDICDEAWKNVATSGAAVIYVRKTATDKAPASVASLVGTVYKEKAAPSITVSGSAVTFATSDEKGKFAKVSGITGANDKGGYEILVVKESYFKDESTIAKIDWTKSKWTKFDPSKGTKAKLSSKISYDGTTETVAALGDDGKPVSGVLILIRGTGVKADEKKKIDGALPTDYLKTKFVANSDNAKKIDWQLVPTTEP